jgi:cytochrome c553
MRRACRARAIVAALLAGALPAMAADPPEKLAPCLTCHGTQGQSESLDVPSLGAQPAPYTVIQLFMFRKGLRGGEPMNAMSKEHGVDDLQSAAQFLAELPPPKPPTDAGYSARLERGNALARQHHCVVCHRPDFSGYENVPRLADQREDYLLKTLRDYKSGARHGYDATMAEVLQPVDDAQLVELSYYLAHLPAFSAEAPTGVSTAKPTKTAPAQSAAAPEPAPSSLAAPTPTSPSSRLSAAKISELLGHGDADLKRGDVASARLFYERAAVAGDARAALRLGATFDPTFLGRAGLRNVRGDSVEARLWYGRALNLGAAEAKPRLDNLDERQGR